ncbi:amidophosphoribosyltransferase [Thermococcus guaymasensis DSM 11113]|uniref:Amidophosphoribosyltransferase n=1 Tax=Thermococcus guaymasensis DSM 11113 TaxID=1432656 RepID=A0A0X1KL31_9EURY|nr:amidophosphoribosyltransferase [Thermococcus guaymasensis]AJC71945.1 amidophosphoribosyltransferase [Thermococcus guaymasensis DSM 11113]
MREKCGIFATVSENAPKKAYYALIALQHRGQESAGISVWRQGIKTVAGRGLVSEVFRGKELSKLKSRLAIAHVRYSTSGSLNETQPLETECCGKTIAVAHNGTLTNFLPLRRHYERLGVKFKHSVDSELLGISFLWHINETGDEFEAMRAVFNEVKGAYSVALLFDGKILVARDPVGFRPLSYGTGDGHYFASEDSALRLFAEDVRDVRPGEAFLLSEGGVESKVLAKESHHHCVFEYIYFARPDSTIDGVNVYTARVRMGEELARESPADGDVVIAVPDSGRAAALGFSRVSGIPYSEGLIKNRYIGRTFITPGQFYRELKVRLKLSPVKEVVEGKRVVLIDDSIVRGTTMKRIVAMLRKAGAKEVHVRIASPPIRHPCYMGIDIPTRHELIAAFGSVENVRKAIGADSLAYLSVEGLKRAVGREDLCLACLTGEYPEWAFRF